MKKDNANIWITKNSGVKAQFSKEKLRRSLLKSSAKNRDINYIISEIEKMLYPGISTQEIYKKAFALLRKTSRHTAAKYKLKRALMELGPSGFPFERYFAEVLKHSENITFSFLPFFSFSKIAIPSLSKPGSIPSIFIIIYSALV